MTDAPGAHPPGDEPAAPGTSVSGPGPDQIPLQPAGHPQPGQVTQAYPPVPGQATPPGYPAVPGQPPPYPPGYPPVPGQPGPYPTGYPPVPGPPAPPYPPGYPSVPGQPTPYPPGQGYPQPGQAPPGFPPTQPGPPTGQPGIPPQPWQQPTGGRRGRGLLVVSLVLGLVVALCGVGGVVAFLLTRNDGGQGRSSPAAAVNGFLDAVYTERDAGKAASFVCTQARDQDKLSKKIAEIRRQESGYDSPAYTWTTPQTVTANSHEATLTTTVTLATAKDQYATLPLKLVTVHSNGWFVCDIQPGNG